jgi:ABC-type multidrug transport system ATPase subunit
MIRELVADGTTVLLTTQYLEEADRLAHRVAVIDGGHVIANDTPAALKAQLGSTVIELDMGEESRAIQAGGLLAGLSEGRPDREGAMIRLSAEDGSHLLMEALRVLDGKDLAPAKLTVREPSLDDVFLSLTGHRAEGETTDAPDDGARPTRGAA